MKLQNHTTIIGFAISAAFFAVGCSGCGSSGSTGSTGSVATSGGSSTTIMGAGSTFVDLAMKTWVYEYKQSKGVEVNYQAVGSGAGISQYKAGTVDFGATDAPLTDKDLADLPPTDQFPIAAGCEVLAYNIPGVSSGLKLSPDAIAGIFLGKITSWDDPAIAGDNAGVKLPHQNITVVHRADSSGTTFIFTDYLSTISPTWKSGPGQGKSISFPVGVGAKGNDGVAATVKQTPGSIGYVELAFAVQNKLQYGPIKNASGAFVDPSIQSTTAAVDSAKDALAKDIRTSIVNQAGKDAYPIAGMTYVVIARQPKDAKKGQAVKDFLNWDLTEGQTKVAALQYAPLPASVVALGQARLGGSAASGDAKK